MYSKILSLLIIRINYNLKQARVSLETEEKTKEIAILQGRIVGFKKLKENLVDLFGNNIPYIYDEPEDEPLVIEGIPNSELKILYEEMEALTDSKLWKELLKRVSDNREILKEHLFTLAESARELYLAQAEQAGLTVYNGLFETLRDEFERRKEELDFSDAVPFEEEQPAEDTTKKRLPRQLQLPAPKKRRGKKK